MARKERSVFPELPEPAKNSVLRANSGRRDDESRRRRGPGWKPWRLEYPGGGLTVSSPGVKLIGRGTVGFELDDRIPGRTRRRLNCLRGDKSVGTKCGGARPVPSSPSDSNSRRGCRPDDDDQSRPWTPSGEKGSVEEYAACAPVASRDPRLGPVMASEEQPNAGVVRCGIDHSGRWILRQRPTTTDRLSSRPVALKP